MTYRPPVRDMSFALNEIAGLKDLCGSKAFPDLEPDLIEQVLEESGRMAGNLLAPLNWTGDQQGAQLGADGVKAPDGFADAYKQWFEAGWCSISSTAPTSCATNTCPNCCPASGQAP